MCSRYTYNKDEAKLRLREQLEIFGAVPHGDIRPTDIGPVIIPEFEGFLHQEMRWGWKEPWDTGLLINAKSESLTTLRTFKPHLQNRCLLLTDGFYEKGVLFRQQGQVFCFAGLWREEKDGRKYTMLTTTPNDTVAPYHHRMPFILRPEQHVEWLEGDWKQILNNPDRSSLEKLQNQPNLFE